MPGIDHLKEQPLWSESVYLDCVSADGGTGFVVRLCRYPTERTAWLWAHVFLPGETYAYTDHYLHCNDTVTPVESEHVVYRLDADADMSMTRVGPRASPEAASVSISASLHLDPQAGHGPGKHDLDLAATFTPLGASGTTVPGRVELLGRVQVSAGLDGEDLRFEGFGHWHEQHQEQPRFLRPFTYVTLRGERLAFVLTRGQARATGYARRDGVITPVTGFDIDPYGPRRSFRLELADGTELRGEARTTHAYSIPIYDLRRPGTLVVAEVDGQPLSGCINDHMRD